MANQTHGPATPHDAAALRQVVLDRLDTLGVEDQFKVLFEAIALPPESDGHQAVKDGHLFKFSLVGNAWATAFLRFPDSQRRPDSECIAWLYAGGHHYPVGSSPYCRAIDLVLLCVDRLAVKASALDSER